MKISNIFKFLIIFFSFNITAEMVTSLARLEIELAFLNQSLTPEIYPKKLFVSFSLPDSMRNIIFELQEEVKKITGSSANVAFISPQDFHIGLYHLGQQDKNNTDQIIKTLQEFVDNKKWLSGKDVYEIIFEKNPILITPKNKTVGNLVALWANDTLLDHLFFKVKEALSDIAPYKYDPPYYLQHITLGSLLQQNLKETIYNKNLIHEFEEELSSMQLTIPKLPFSDFVIVGGKTRELIYRYNLKENNVSNKINNLEKPFIMIEVNKKLDDQTLFKDKIFKESKQKIFENQSVIKIGQKNHYVLEKRPKNSNQFHLTLYEKKLDPGNVQDAMNADLVHQKLSEILPELVAIYNEHQNNVYATIGGHSYFENGHFTDEDLRPYYGKLKFIPGFIANQELLVVPVYGHYLSEIQNELAKKLTNYKEKPQSFQAHITIARFNNPSPALKRNIIENITIKPAEPFKLPILTLKESLGKFEKNVQQYYPVHNFAL